MVHYVLELSGHVLKVMYTGIYVAVLLYPSVGPSSSRHTTSSLLVSSCAYSHINRAPRVRPRSHLKGGEPPVHTLSGCSMCVEIWLFLLRGGGGQALGVKKERDGAEGRWGSQATKVRQHTARQQSVSRLPAACRGEGRGRGEGGGGFWPVREWGGWLNDFTSPFQLQQLPIYIVMQIHGLSQMVLFQHRGCIEIWLFIPSTSKVFNAPSSVCFYPFLPSWQPFKICAALMCLSPAVTERREREKIKKKKW